MQPDGTYRARRAYVTDDAVHAHLTGEIALAFAVATKAQATGQHLVRFAALDIDQYFSERLPVIAGLVRDLRIDHAVFATGGSGPGKGKIIFTFAEMIPRPIALPFIGAVYTEAHRAAPTLFPAEPRDGDVECFPKGATFKSTDAGLLRVLGRHVNRDGPLELPLTLDGQPCDLTQIRPLRVSEVKRVAALRPMPTAPAWVTKLADADWSAFDRTKRFKKTFALACLVRESGGSESTYTAMLQRIIDRNPGLRSSQSDDRHPIRREIAELAIWHRSHGHTSFSPMVLPASDPGARAYNALYQHARQRGLNPRGFFADSREIAALMGCAQSTAQARLDTAETHRLVVRLDYGTARTEEMIDGKRRVIQGQSATWALVGRDQTVYDALALLPAGLYDRARIAAPYIVADMVLHCDIDAAAA